MIALRKTAAAFGAELVRMAAPAVPSADSVIIEVAATGICGSDVHAYEWTPGYEFMSAHLPLTIGHEFSGIVRSVGAAVTERMPGERVVCWPTIACTRCTACMAGRPQHCPERKVIGLHRNGGFAGCVEVPARNCFRVPDGLDLETAALAEPLSIAVNAVDVADIGEGDRVVVLGPGPIGLGAAWVATRRGAQVLIAGFNDTARLTIARDMGIAGAVDLATTSLDNAVTAAFGDKADRVIEATGIVDSITDGLAVLRPGGILTAAGIHTKPLELDLTRFIREKKQLRAAHDTTHAAFEEAISLLSGNASSLSRMITHRKPLAEAAEAFALARARQAVKVMLIPPQEEDQ